MTAHTASNTSSNSLMLMRNNLIMHQGLYAAAKLGIPDLLERRPSTAAELASELKVHEESLYRTLRALASQGVFEETASGTFQNTDLSRGLLSGAPGALRPYFIFWGTELYYRSLGEILHSIESGQPAREKLFGNLWEYIQQHPEVAGIFDDAMTNNSDLMGPSIADAYDFGAWESIMDVGGGNGILLSHLLRRHTMLRGVLADQQHVVERARERGFLGGDLITRTSMEECDFFREVPSGCRSYLMKSVIHDWNDEKAKQILNNCRKAVPANGALFLVEWGLSEANQPDTGKLIDLVMMVLTGGKERTVAEYKSLLSSTGFRLNKVIPTASEMVIIEAIPN